MNGKKAKLLRRIAAQLPVETTTIYQDKPYIAGYTKRKYLGLVKSSPIIRYEKVGVEVPINQVKVLKKHYKAGGTKAIDLFTIGKFDKMEREARRKVRFLIDRIRPWNWYQKRQLHNGKPENSTVWGKRGMPGKWKAHFAALGIS